jgi:hypothetical protein
MQSTTFEQLTPTAAEMILEQLPERIQKAFVQRAAEIDYPLEAVLEMAMAGYLDREAKRKRDESRSRLSIVSRNAGNDAQTGLLNNPDDLAVTTRDLRRHWQGRRHSHRDLATKSLGDWRWDSPVDLREPPSLASESCAVLHRRDRSGTKVRHHSHRAEI